MIRRLRERTAARDDAGFTLAELLVYSILLIVVMTIAGAIFIQMLTTQRDVTAMANANNDNQVAFKGLERDIRNAAAAKVMNGGTVLLLQTRAATDANPDYWLCVGYYLDVTDGTLRHTQGTGITQTKPISSLTSDAAIHSATASWGKGRPGFKKLGTSRPFGVVDGVYASPDQLQVRLSALTQNGHDPVSFRKTIGMRPQGSYTLSGCM